MSRKKIEKALPELEKDIVPKAKSANIPGLSANDIAQEFRLALLIRLEKFDPRRSSLRTFANRIMCTVLIDLYRKNIRTIRVPVYRKPDDEE